MYAYLEQHTELDIVRIKVPSFSPPLHHYLLIIHFGVVCRAAVCYITMLFTIVISLTAFALLYFDVVPLSMHEK